MISVSILPVRVCAYICPFVVVRQVYLVFWPRFVWKMSCLVKANDHIHIVQSLHTNSVYIIYTRHVYDLTKDLLRGR